MKIFFSKLVVLLTVRRNLCIRAGHCITCTPDSKFYGRRNLEYAHTWQCSQL